MTTEIFWENGDGMQEVVDERAVRIKNHLGDAPQEVAKRNDLSHDHRLPRSRTGSETDSAVAIMVGNAEAWAGDHWAAWPRVRFTWLDARSTIGRYAPHSGSGWGPR